MDAVAEGEVSARRLPPEIDLVRSLGLERGRESGELRPDVVLGERPLNPGDPAPRLGEEPRQVALEVSPVEGSTAVRTARTSELLMAS